jgi:NhaA family Na+:H+ antiporter
VTSEPAAPRLLSRMTRPLQRFLELEASSTLLLLLGTVCALAWANSPWAASYEHLLHVPLAARIGSAELELTLHHFVNDALMALFFFVVGLEIKRELVIGELSSLGRAMLPVLAAVGGMLLPALFFLALNGTGPAARGWGIPMATDIAFAVAALSVFGSRVPSGLKVFLLALAIADDIGAVTVIALFYTEHLSVVWLAWAAGGLLFTWALNRAGVRAYGVYFAVGALVWLATWLSGVHATIAAVALGFLTPARPLDPAGGRRTLIARSREVLDRLGDLLDHEHDHGGHERHRLAREVSRTARAALSPLDELTNLLHPWVAFAIMPLFAFANAGVTIEPRALVEPVPLRIALGVVLGLLLGKPLGVALFSWLAVRLGVARLPAGVTWPQVGATGLLAGIGFTVALFISALAFEPPAFGAASKVGILAGSAIATGLGIAWLARALPPAPRPVQPARSGPRSG